MRTALVMLALFVFLQGCGGDRRAVAPTDRACFRLTFGVKDAEPADWSGSVETAQGRVVTLSPWRFDKEDQTTTGSKRVVVLDALIRGA